MPGGADDALGFGEHVVALPGRAGLDTVAMTSAARWSIQRVGDPLSALGGGGQHLADHAR